MMNIPEDKITQSENSRRYHLCDINYKWFIILSLVLLSCIMIYSFRLDFHSLWYDEANTQSLLNNKTITQASKAILETTGSETLHPLYYIILSIWVQFAGQSEFALRFPSVIFGSCAVIVFQLILYEIGGTKAMTYGLALFLSPFLMWYSRDARPYALIMLLSGLNLLIYLNLLKKPKSIVLLITFVMSGVLLVYSGILTSMILGSELIWSLVVRRKIKEIIAIVIIITLTIPLFYNCWVAHLAKSSPRKLSQGIGMKRVLGIPQEFMVGRSLGPTPAQVRQLSFKQTIRENLTELTIEVFGILLMFIAFIISLFGTTKSNLFKSINLKALCAIFFVTVMSLLQILILILVPRFMMNARHLAFLFGPLYILTILPIAFCTRKTVKLMFTLPLLGIWSWSCTNQIFDHSYEVDDYRSAAKIVINDTYNASKVIALCHSDALKYYGIQLPIVRFQQVSDVTFDSVRPYLDSDVGPIWLIVDRPWDYPNFNSAKLTTDFLILRKEELAGITLWLLSSNNEQETFSN